MRPRLRNPALLTLWGGEFASRIGITVFQIALLWYLLERTGDDSLKTGLVTMIAYLPAVLVGLWPSNCLPIHAPELGQDQAEQDAGEAPHHLDKIRLPAGRQELRELEPDGKT